MEAGDSCEGGKSYPSAQELCLWHELPLPEIDVSAAYSDRTVLYWDVLILNGDRLTLTTYRSAHQSDDDSPLSETYSCDDPDNILQYMKAGQ